LRKEAQHEDEKEMSLLVERVLARPFCHAPLLIDVIFTHEIGGKCNGERIVFEQI
jgi:hypothetical protein